jgi:flagellin-like hook-associated protein FlgL
MSAVTNPLSSLYAGYISSAKLKITDIQHELATGVKNLTAGEQKQVSTLTAKAMAYSSALTNITQAQSTVKSAQAGLNKISGLLNDMQMLAMQATTNTATPDVTFRFQSLVEKAGLTAASAGVKGINLLSGTAGMNVKIGVGDNTPAFMTINSVNVSGLLTFGVLSGIYVNTKQNAMDAMNAIRTAQMTVQSGIMELNNSAASLTTLEKNLENSSKATNNNINTIQQLDVPGLKTQLQTLNQKVSVYTLPSGLS